MRHKAEIADVVDSFSAEVSCFTKRQKFAFGLLSLLGAFFLYTFFLLTVRYSVDLTADEGFYLSTCERFLQGDKPILHDWLLPQFVALFQLLPYTVFRTITGGTEGVLLFMRYVTIGVTFLNYCYILLKHRRRPWIALTTTFLFCSFVPLCSFFLGYYTLPPIFLFAVASIIIDEEEKHRKLQLVLSGILLSGAVILVPGLALVWVLYFVFVLIRFGLKKKGSLLFSEYDFVLDIHTFLYILTGVLLCTAVLLVFLQLNCGLKNIIEILPNVRTHPDYDHFSLFSFQNREGLRHFFDSYSLVAVSFFIETLLSVAFVYFRRKRTLPTGAKTALFCINCLLLAASLVASLQKQIILMEAPIFVSWFGFNCMLLCKKSNPKMLFFWLVGAAMSFVQDFTSAITCCFGYVVSILPTLVFLCQLIKELRDEASASEKRKTQKMKRAVPCAALEHAAFPRVLGSAAIALLLLWSIINVTTIVNVFRILPREEGQVTVTRGPHKGIVLPKRYAKIYENVLTDLDHCMEMTEGPVYVMGNDPFAYVYMRRSIPVAATLNALESMNDTYWEIYPERRPDLIYIPIEEEDTSIYISEDSFHRMPETQQVNFGWFEGNVVKGERGLIVRVTAWHRLPELKP